MKTELANYLNTETEKLKAQQRAERAKSTITYYLNKQLDGNGISLCNEAFGEVFPEIPTWHPVTLKVTNKRPHVKGWLKACLYYRNEGYIPYVSIGGWRSQLLIGTARTLVRDFNLDVTVDNFLWIQAKKS